LIDVRQQIEELCENHKCRYFLYFEVKKKINFSIWLGRYPEGPSVKLLVSGMVLTKDIKFQGNCVKGSRHILSFEKVFHFIIIKKYRICNHLQN
jgi:ribosome biogenesis protein BRX1